MFPENPEGTRVIVGSMNMGYVSTREAAVHTLDLYWKKMDVKLMMMMMMRTRTRNLFCLEQAPMPLGHSDRV